MPLVWQVESLTMQWCLDCHSEPEEHLRPPDAVYVMGWEPPAEQSEQGEELVAHYGIVVEQLTDCSVCHR
jgi:hypothetical protein